MESSRTQGGAGRNNNDATRSALGWIVSQPFGLNSHGNNTYNSISFYALLWAGSYPSPLG